MDALPPVDLAPPLTPEIQKLLLAKPLSESEHVRMLTEDEATSPFAIANLRSANYTGGHRKTMLMEQVPPEDAAASLDYVRQKVVIIQPGLIPIGSSHLMVKEVS